MSLRKTLHLSSRSYIEEQFWWFTSTQEGTLGLSSLLDSFSWQQRSRLWTQNQQNLTLQPNLTNWGEKPFDVVALLSLSHTHTHTHRRTHTLMHTSHLTRMDSHPHTQATHSNFHTRARSPSLSSSLSCHFKESRLQAWPLLLLLQPLPPLLLLLVVNTPSLNFHPETLCWLAFLHHSRTL